MSGMLPTKQLCINSLKGRNYLTKLVYFVGHTKVPSLRLTTKQITPFLKCGYIDFRLYLEIRGHLIIHR